MHLKRVFDAGGWPRWLAGTLGVLLFLGVVTTVTAEPPERLKKDRPERSLTGADHITRLATMDRNRVIMFLTDQGEVGSSGSSVAGGGFWITTQNQYIFSSGANIGAKIPNGDGDGNELDTVMFIGGPFSQLQHGSLEFASIPNATGAGHGVSSAAGVFWDSADAADAANFPEPCTVDAFRISLFPSLQPFAGQPFPGFADQTVCWAVNDITGGICADCGGKRLGAESVQTAFAFGVPAVQDFVFVAYRLFNRSEFINASNSPSNAAGPYDFTDAILGLAIDPDVGDAGDDQITFFPDIGTMIYWDSDFSETAFVAPPGFGAISVFPVPDPVTGESFRLESFTVFTNGGIRPDPDSPQEWYEGLAGDPSFVAFEVSPQDIRGMTGTNPFDLAPGDFVEIYAAHFFAPPEGAPPQLLLAEKPFLDDNTTPDPNANQHPAFGAIVRTQQTAQATFDAGFVVPTAPPKPAFTLIPGDHQVTIVWEGDPVDFVNPFAKVARNPFARTGTGDPDPDAPGQGFVLEAGTVIFLPERDQGGTTGFITAEEAGLVGVEVTNPAFNPNFVIQDFEGFRVYRTFTGSSEDAELIAQFDLSNGITGGDFCVAAVPVFDADGNFVENVCTDQTQLPIGTNTGLSFSVVDRGGSFPNPGNGPGLINGIPISYTVTSFSVNPGQSPVSIPEGTSTVPAPAPLVLESGLAPFQSVTPRSDASSFATASATITPVNEAGEPCDPSGPTATVDPANGDFLTHRPCTNAMAGVNVTSIRGENLPSGDFFLVIDSLTLQDPSQYQGGYGIAFTGGNRAWYHWETEDGAVADLIQPAVGSFDQIFEFVFAAPTDVSWTIDTNPNDVGVDASIAATFVADFSAAKDLVVNGQSAIQGDLGGEVVGIFRPRRVDNSSVADMLVMGNVRNAGNLQRAYANPGNFATGGTSYALTWSVQGGTYSGTVHALGTGAEVPRGGQPKGPDNPSTPGDFIAGHNWGFIGPDAPANVRAAVFPPAAPLTNEMQLNQGDTFAIMVPGQSIYVEGIRDLPEDGETWEIMITSGWTPNGLGLEPTEDGGWTYVDFNTESAQGHAFPVTAGITSVYPGARWRLSIQGGSNELADADLSQVRVVPNPFIAADELQRGRGLQRIQFTNLPPQATVRIYTISGNLVRVLEHTDGSGTMEWDVRTRFDLLAASGNYYYHVTTPDGRTHLGRFAVIN